MAYPDIVDISSSHAARPPFPSVTRAIENPHLRPASAGQEEIPERSEPATSEPSPLTTAVVQALDTGCASRCVETSAKTISTGMSISSKDDSDHHIDQSSSYIPANGPFTGHEFAHMAPWAEDDINRLMKK